MLYCIQFKACPLRELYCLEHGIHPDGSIPAEYQVALKRDSLGNFPHHPSVSTLLRRTLLTIRSQPSSRKLGRESTFQGGTYIVLISHKKIIQRDHFRAIMVDLEPTVVDEVGLEYKTCFQNFTFSCVTTFFSVAGENGYLSSHFHFHTFR